LPGIRVGVGRDRACIQDYEVRLRNSRNATEAFIFKGSLNTRAISLRGPATEALNENALQNLKSLPLISLLLVSPEPFPRAKTAL
jgi:hypothetical protein